MGPQCSNSSLINGVLNKRNKLTFSCWSSLTYIYIFFNIMEVNRDQQLKVNYLFTGRKDIMVTLWVREEGIGSLGADTE